MAEVKTVKSEASTSRGAVGGGNGDRGESVVFDDFGRRSGTCGYCKSGSRSSLSHGLWFNSLTVDDYQALLDRGWRRSGCFLYKPEMEKTCCPSYTIRLKASDFVPSKEQTRVYKRMQRFLDGTLDVKKEDMSTDVQDTSKGSCSMAHDYGEVSATTGSSAVGKDKANQIMHLLSDQINNSVQLCMKNGEVISNFLLPTASVKKVPSAKRKLEAERLEELVFSCNIAFQISAILRRLNKDAENAKSSEYGKEGNGDLSELSPKRIAEILTSHLKQQETCGLSVRACNGHINFYSSKRQPVAFEVERSMVSESSTTASSSNDKHSKKSCGGIQAQKLTFEIRLKRSSFDSEEYSLYRKYQLRVHNDLPAHVTESSYKRFLVDTPLVYIEPTDDGAVPPCGFGSFHQQYIVDGKLIAVGVFDILPKCLSSKYLFWDPDFAFLSLGKYSALQEIKWVCENQVHCPSLQYYYLGYYIHSCSKMRYKAAYRPSELLCPLRYQWVLYDTAKPFLDREKYVVLSDCTNLQIGESSSLNTLDCHMEDPHNGHPQEAPNDVLVNGEEMSELDSNSSDDELNSEDGSETTMALDDVDLSNVLLSVRGESVGYKDIQHALYPSQKELFERRLRRYVMVVGGELSQQMLYFVG